MNQSAPQAIFFGIIASFKGENMNPSAPQATNFEIIASLRGKHEPKRAAGDKFSKLTSLERKT